jgi:glycosyltransferase involved in cell wall biosynthesis
MPLLFSKSAIVIYDISFELYQQFSDERNAQFLSGAVTRSIQSTNHIITISQNAKKEIVDFYKINPNFVTVATPATNPTLLYRRSIDEIEKTKRKYNIQGEYILALSNLEPRKNLGTLVRAYCKLPEKVRNEYSLLLVGVSGWKTDKLFSDIVKRVKEGYSIIRPSEYVDDKDKAAIISGASILVYPSHYEGFGMPPLEALACGTPVITANNSSLPEVVGKVGIMVESKDEDQLRESIIKVLGDSSIAKSTIKEGPKRARLFSWKKSAEIILEMVDNLS